MMGRGRIEIKRIEDNTNRQVTFCKRRMGLIKKARELSILCDADVALLVVSTYGRVYKFASSKDMEHILDDACSTNKTTTNGEHGLNRPDPMNISAAAAQPPQINNLNSTEESLKRQLEELQKELRLMNGEVKDICNIKQLVKLEAKIKQALQKVNKHKYNVCSKELRVLGKKHKQLEKENNELRKKIQATSEPSADELSMTSNNSALENFNDCDTFNIDDAIHTVADSGDEIFLELRLMGSVQ